MDRTKSDKIIDRFNQNPIKMKRIYQEFTGTWNATVEDIFPLLCPSREADWIPGWDCELLYTKSGYAEDKCVFRTDKKNSIGDGLWIFVGYEKNKYITFVRFQEDIITHTRINVDDNQDGTASATWLITQTALTKQGNLLLSNMPNLDGKPITKMIDHYLTHGKTVRRVSLALDGIHTKIRGH
jgi:hypothetical protein